MANGERRIGWPRANGARGKVQSLQARCECGVHLSHYARELGNFESPPPRHLVPLSISVSWLGCSLVVRASLSLRRNAARNQPTKLATSPTPPTSPSTHRPRRPHSSSYNQLLSTSATRTDSYSSTLDWAIGATSNLTYPLT